MGLLDQAGQGGGAAAPKLAQAAAQAGAPGGGAPAAPNPNANPLQGGPPPGAGAPPPGAGAPPPAQATPPGAGAPPGAPAPAQGGVRTVDPTAPAVPGQLPENMPGMKEEQASPEEQKAYETAMKSLSQLLYGNDKIANSIVDQVDPNDKVSSTAKVSMLLISQLDKKINMDDAIVAEVTKETTGRIMELAEARHSMEYGEREMQVILGSVWEGVQQMFGMEKQAAESLMVGVGGEGLADLKQQYEGFVNG